MAPTTSSWSHPSPSSEEYADVESEGCPTLPTKKLVVDEYPLVRRAFVQKVYTILLLQIAFTCAIVYTVRVTVEGHVDGVNENLLVTIFYVSFFAAFFTLCVLTVMDKSYPLNLALLFLFTLLESTMLSVGLLRVDLYLLVQSFVTTCSVFVGLTLYTIYEKTDFDFLRSYLFSALWILLFGGVMQMFFPASSLFHAMISWGGALVFSGYVVYDTFLLHKKLHADQYVFAAVSLYLDFINLFLYILRILSSRKK